MNDELRSLGSARARGIALLLAVGVAGGAAGGAIDRWWMARSAGSQGEAVTAERGTEPASGASRRGLPRADQGPGSTEGVPDSLRAVKLTPQQVERLRALTARYQPAAESLMRSIRPRIMELNARMQQEAMCVLTPEQRSEWISWRKREGLDTGEATQMLELATSGRCPTAPKQ